MVYGARCDASTAFTTMLDVIELGSTRVVFCVCVCVVCALISESCVVVVVACVCVCVCAVCVRLQFVRFFSSTQLKYTRSSHCGVTGTEHCAPFFFRSMRDRQCAGPLEWGHTH